MVLCLVFFALFCCSVLGTKGGPVFLDYVQCTQRGSSLCEGGHALFFFVSRFCQGGDNVGMEGGEGLL